MPAAHPVARDDLARVVGQGASVDLLIEDLAVDLEGRPYEVAQVGAGWMLRTRAAYAPAIRAAADVEAQALNLSEFDLAVLAAIAFHQPISRDGLKDIFGKEISRDLIGRLAERDLIGTGPREPRRGAPYTFVTTEAFLAAFGMDILARPARSRATGRCRPGGTIGRPWTVRDRASCDRKCCDLREAGLLPAARRPDQALWRRRPAPARQFRQADL